MDFNFDTYHRYMLMFGYHGMSPVVYGGLLARKNRYKKHVCKRK